MAKRKTVGKVASDLAQKTPDTLSPIDIQRATEKEYIDNLIWCIKHARKEIDCSSIDGHQICKDRIAFDKDFYIAVLLKKEKLLENVLRNYFIPTVDCPTPFFDQTVYKYHHDKEDLEFMWVIPDEETALTLWENKDIVVKEEQGLLNYVIQYFDGTLLNLAKRLNGETKYAGSALERK